MKTRKSPKLKAAIRVQSKILSKTAEVLRSLEFDQILPVILSPVTDPLNHAVGMTEIDYYGDKVQLMKSMIFHKQITLLTLDRIFCYSPNVRLEPLEAIHTGRHLSEFTQLDLEVKNGTRDQLIQVGEILVSEIVEEVFKRCEPEMRVFQRSKPLINLPFARLSYEEMMNKYGEFEDPETALSMDSSQPVWIIDFPIDKREFYDREDLNRPGTLIDMDLIYPEGYGEALSGGEREYQYHRIIKRMKKAGSNPEDFKAYLEIVRKGVSPSAGFGIGIERMTRWICGVERIEEVTLFPKCPGKITI